MNPRTPSWASPLPQSTTRAGRVPRDAPSRSFAVPSLYLTRSPSAPGSLGHNRQSLFEMAPGLINISPGDGGHCHGSGDDHISQFVEEVIAAAADPLARVQAVHADERFRGLAGLLGQLEQLYLDRDFPMAGVQVTDLIPHTFS